jgi:hypothetical protein
LSVLAGEPPAVPVTTTVSKHAIERSDGLLQPVVLVVVTIFLALSWDSLGTAKRYRLWPALPEQTQAHRDAPGPVGGTQSK